MEQTKLESMIETSINVASGFIISLILWVLVVIPVWDLDVTMFDNIAITCLFIVVSITRGYFWRRFFNAQIHKKIHSFVSSVYTACRL